GDHICRPTHAVADFHLQFRLEPGWNVQLGATAELDHADALPAFEQLAFLGREDDPPCDHANDLLDDGDWPSAGRLAEHDGVGFIFFRREIVAHRIDELAFLALNRQHAPIAGAAIDVNIENAQENSDAHARPAEQIRLQIISDVG